jgi:hypothetical protein
VGDELTATNDPERAAFDWIFATLDAYMAALKAEYEELLS